MPNMRTALAAASRGRHRSASLSTVIPPVSSDDYLPELWAIASSILYRSPYNSLEGRPVYILNAAAFPDAFEVDYDSLLAYVLARLPGEDELIAGTDYEVVFFAGGTPDNATQEKKQGPNTGWYLQAYHVLSRALRKKLQRLYIVHPRTWVRVLISVFGTIVSPKFRRKIVHVNSLSQLALHLPVEKLLIPPSAYLQDRKFSSDVYAPFVTGKRAFGVRQPLHISNTGETRLPRVLRETTSFLLFPPNVKTEGIFRIPPHNILAGVLKEAYDRGQQFIVWKEPGATFVAPGMDTALVNEVRLEDAYGVHLAASLIKTWYRELKDPVFPESCYAELRERYQDPATEVTFEEVVGLISPRSTSSPLTKIAREIMTRHLLPLLSIVASYETFNKMNQENLALIFAMCLVRSSDEMADVKISGVIKRTLQAAIQMWPQLRSRIGSDEGAFSRDVQPPSDPKDYEDPLEDAKPPQTATDGGNDEDLEGHRIIMTEADSPPSLSPEGPPPKLPPRRSRASSLKQALKTNIPEFDLSSISRPKIELPMIPGLPKRKPAPHLAPEPPSPLSDGATVFDQTSVPQPPRYSSLFDRDGRNVAAVEESPAIYVPPEEAVSPRGADLSSGGEQNAASYPDQSVYNHMVAAMAAVPKRKALSGSQKSSPESTPVTPLSRQPSDTHASAVRRVPVPEISHTTGDITTSPADIGVPNSAITESSFRKPSWPASAYRSQPSNIQSLARPIHASTFPLVSNDTSTRNLTAPHVPKPRTPSPGLLQRMNSMETQHINSSLTRASSTGSSGMLQPNKLNLKKTSVEDLRRLYEERANTAETLAGVVRRQSSHH